MTNGADPRERRGHRGRRQLIALLPWAITAAAFGFLYLRLSRAAAAQGRPLAGYLADVLAAVDWQRWLALMIPFSLAYFVLDTAVIWLAIRWFAAPVTYREMLPVRGSAYILSIVNEQVGKAALALYLNRRHRVPAAQAASSMLLVMVCEFLHLVAWAAVGVLAFGDRLPDAFRAVPWIALGSAAAFAAFVAVARGPARGIPLLAAFARARLWQYGALIGMRVPLMAAAIGVYTAALALFGVQIGLGEMAGYLPVVLFGASTPGPMRSVAVVLWVALIPAYPGQMAAFGLAQHNLFLLVNALIGVAFLRTATRSLAAD